MSDEEFSPIRPRSVPLSHVQRSADSPRAPGRAVPWRGAAIAVVAIALLVMVFVVVPDYIAPPVVTTHPAPVPGPDTGATATPGAATGDDAPPPFEALLRQQTREKAQAELSRFVELQMKLQDTMQVGTWGQESLDAAKALATRGDEQFVAEDFENSLASYSAASDALAALIDQGEAMLEAALARGADALDARDQKTALASFQRALTIDPDNQAATRGLARAEQLPRIIDLMREAKNHELAGDFRAAVDTYETVRDLDPETHGLDEALASARAGVTDLVFKEHLSDGFKAMDAGHFESARQAFNAALALRPDDPVALGGLEQVAERKDLATIRRLRASAEDLEAAERWHEAADTYAKVLALDDNIQFAKSGRARALAQERTGIKLGNIIASPDKLSSKSLFGQAHDILEEAKSLSPRGPKLAAQIARVEDLLTTYATPVPVLFRSDNRTEITLSTVGRLGTFEEKELSLRPGAYTIIGSRDGCRDVRESILVRPDMQPVDIRCEETF
jgi:tetratricopeptide (TPR) repeat protein